MSRFAPLTLLALVGANAALAAAPEPAPEPRRKVRLSEVRAPEMRKKLLADAGGTEKTEKAVADALKWLAEKQQKDGAWDFDAGPNRSVSATGLAVLCFLGAGHGPTGDGAYAKNVANGIATLVKMQNPESGAIAWASAPMMYEHAIATLALVEAYSMTGDPKLKAPCQKALDLIVSAQHKTGGWRYEPRFPTDGDVSVTGWVVQVLVAARAHTDLSVPEATLDKANAFLEKCARGEKKVLFAYQSYSATSSASVLNNACTPSGLCSKAALEGWTADNERLAAGVAELLKRQPDPERATAVFNKNNDGYYLYYATRAVYLRGGDDWAKTWNPKLQETLLKRQDKNGSWPADPGQYLRGYGKFCGTCFAVLTLETYYRYPPHPKDQREVEFPAPGSLTQRGFAK